MKRFFWVKYYEFSGKTRTLKNGKSSRAKDSLSSNAKAEFCKAIALKKVGDKIKIPQRQFMGESRTLMSHFDTWFAGNVEIVFKQHLNNK